MSIIGYARVSTIGQSLEVQIDKLITFGCNKLFTEKKSGLDDKRPALVECLNYLRDGDTLVITKIDRLARSTTHLHKIVSDLNAQGIGLKVLDQNFDTTTKEGRLLFGMLALIAEFETDLRKERQLEGIAKAKSNGVKFGRQLTLTPELIATIKSERSCGALIKDLMSEYKLSKSTVYRALK